MDMNDLILVSVDDHVVEPPDMFERPPARSADRERGAASDPQGRRHRRLGLRGQRDPEHRAQRRRRPAARGVRHRADRRSTRCAPAATTSTSASRDMNANGVLGSMCFPSFPQFCGQLFSRSRGQGRSASPCCRAYNDWHIDEWCGTYPGRFIPLVDPADLGPGADGRRGAPGRGEGLPRGHVLGEPRQARLARASTATTGTRSGRRAATRARSSACTSARRRSSSITSVDAPIDVMITLQPMNIVQAAADLLWSPVLRKFPDLRIALSEGGIGWIPYFLERIDYIYQHHQRVDRARTSATSCRARCSTSASSPASSTTLPGVEAARRPRHRHDHVGVRLPALRLDVAELARGLS